MTRPPRRVGTSRIRELVNSIWERVRALPSTADVGAQVLSPPEPWTDAELDWQAAQIQAGQEWADAHMLPSRGPR